MRLIYDDVGSWGLSRRYIRHLRNAGVEVQCFMRVVFPWLTSKVNYRNHRKILVVDGHIGFTGGINIAQRYLTGTKMGRGATRTSNSKAKRYGCCRSFL